MEVKYKGYTVYGKALNSFGDQMITVTNKSHDVIYQTTNSEGAWITTLNEVKALVNNLIK